LNICIYLKIRLSNGQLDNLSTDRRERIYSDCSIDDHLDKRRTNPLYLSRYRNSCWFRCRTTSSSSSPFDEYNSSLNSTTAYARLKRFTERLLQLERKARETVIDNKCHHNISSLSSKTDYLIEKTNQSSIKTDDRLTSTVNEQQMRKKSFHLPIQNSLNLK
jgi:hypothetical protein